MPFGVQREKLRRGADPETDSIRAGLDPGSSGAYDNLRQKGQAVLLGEGTVNNMRLVGNILWFIFGGIISGVAWLVAGCIWCATVIGIPIGLQCFKLASLSFFPFGREVEYGGSAVSFLVNVVWFLVSGLELALTNFIFGCLWCITIVGIPFGKQFFKIAKLALRPFGASVISR